MNSEPLTFRYPASTVWPDIARSGAGVLVCAAPLPWLTDSPVAFSILSSLAVAFTIFTVMTARRLKLVVHIDDAGISTSGMGGGTVSWDRMRTVDLRYYSTRRDRERGWMQLRVRGGASTIRVDSNLEGFTTVADRAITAAKTRDLPLTDITLANAGALATGQLHRPPPEPANRSRYG